MLPAGTATRAARAGSPPVPTLDIFKKTAKKFLEKPYFFIRQYRIIIKNKKKNYAMLLFFHCGS
jgi:hypothetical protein